MPQTSNRFLLPKRPMAAPKTLVSIGGEAVVVVTGPIRGGYIQNPFRSGQGLETEESLFIDMVNTPCSDGAGCRPTTLEILPGQMIALPEIQAEVQVKANAKSSGHKFMAVVW